MVESRRRHGDIVFYVNNMNHLLLGFRKHFYELLKFAVDRFMLNFPNLLIFLHMKHGRPILLVGMVHSVEIAKVCGHRNVVIESKLEYCPILYALD